MKGVKQCKDCKEEGITTWRNPEYPGPRCYTHHLAKKKRVKLHNAERRVEVNFGLIKEHYDALYAAQDNRCFICRISTGKVRRLAVDHDHRCTQGHPPERGCPRCVRALLCKRCNTLVAWWGVEALQRAIEVLQDHPAQKVLATINTP